MNTPPNVILEHVSYTTTDAVTPYGQDTCWESSYDLGRFGPLNFCAVSTVDELFLETACGLCLIFGSMVVDSVS